MIPTVAATITTPTMTATIPTRTTKQMIGTVGNDLPIQKGIAIEFSKMLPIKVILFPCWLLPSLPLSELEDVVIAVLEAAVESVLSPEHTIVERDIIFNSEGQKGTTVQ